MLNICIILTIKSNTTFKMQDTLGLDWMDISVPLSPLLPTWPGDPTLNISLFASYDKGHPCQVTELSLSAHTGTHMDSMRHFIKNGSTMTEWRPEYTIGLVKVFEVKGTTIPVDSLKTFDLQEGDRVIFKTNNSSSPWFQEPFNYNFVCFNDESAAFLASKNIMTVGIDYLSVGNTQNGVVVHNHILGANIWIIEGLYLANIATGVYEMLCLPVKLDQADGVPCRVLLRKTK